MCDGQSTFTLSPLGRGCSDNKEMDGAFKRVSYLSVLEGERASDS